MLGFISFHPDLPRLLRSVPFLLFKLLIPIRGSNNETKVSSLEIPSSTFFRVLRKVGLARQIERAKIVCGFTAILFRRRFEPLNCSRDISFHTHSGLVQQTDGCLSTHITTLGMWTKYGKSLFGSILRQ